MNVNSCIKMAIEMVSPFNCESYLANLNRIKRRKEREDYIGIDRLMLHGITKAVGILQGSESLLATTDTLRSENAIAVDLNDKMMEQNERLQQEVRTEKANAVELEQQNARLQQKVRDMERELAGCKRYIFEVLFSFKY